MGISKGPANAGQGGKRGHSNMEHWECTEEIKTAARKRRRLEAKSEIARGLAERQDIGEESNAKKEETGFDLTELTGRFEFAQ